MTMHTLPPFPVDDATLDLLTTAIDPRGNGDEMAERSSLGELLDLMSTLGGSDTRAVAGEHGGIVELRDPQYHHGDVILALVAEVRRLRTGEHPHVG